MYRMAIVATLVLGACATPRQYGAAQQQMPFNALPRSSASASSVEAGDSEFSYATGKGLSVPRRGRSTDAVNLVVRPDVITAEFAIRDVRPTSPEALAAARKTSAEVLEQINKATGGAPSAKLRSVAAMKVFRNGKPDEQGLRHKEFVGVEITVDGLIEVPLRKEFDFWARSQLFVTMLELTTRLSEAAESKDEPLRGVSFENITPAVKDPEAYRPALTERWVAQARAFAAAAQAKDAPLALVDCAPPQAISQTQSSLEEVTLQLGMSCRLDVAGAPARAGRAPATPATNRRERALAPVLPDDE
jgi:hypothetical protein